MARHTKKASIKLVSRQALYNASKLRKEDGYNQPGSQNAHKGSALRASKKR